MRMKDSIDAFQMRNIASKSSLRCSKSTFSSKISRIGEGTGTLQQRTGLSLSRLNHNVFLAEIQTSTIIY